jgi:hypothetical protein
MEPTVLTLKPFTIPKQQPVQNNFNNHWDKLHSEIRAMNIQRHVHKFVANIKASVVKTSVPQSVKRKLESNMHIKEDTSPKGWSPWRLDVLLMEILFGLFHGVAIFLYTVRVVLKYADWDVFPLLYLGVLSLSCFYKLNTQILIDDYTITRKRAIWNNYI